jgi:hypothetical protein
VGQNGMKIDLLDVAIGGSLLGALGAGVIVGTLLGRSMSVKSKESPEDPSQVDSASREIFRHLGILAAPVLGSAIFLIPKRSLIAGLGATILAVAVAGSAYDESHKKIEVVAKRAWRNFGHILLLSGVSFCISNMIIENEKRLNVVLMDLLAHAILAFTTTTTATAMTRYWTRF